MCYRPGVPQPVSRAMRHLRSEALALPPPGPTGPFINCLGPRFLAWKRRDTKNPDAGGCREAKCGDKPQASARCAVSVGLGEASQAGSPVSEGLLCSRHSHYTQPVAATERFFLGPEFLSLQNGADEGTSLSPSDLTDCA